MNRGDKMELKGESFSPIVFDLLNTKLIYAIASIELKAIEMAQGEYDQYYKKFRKKRQGGGKDETKTESNGKA
jgi:hypothetical protein